MTQVKEYGDRTRLFLITVAIAMLAAITIATSVAHAWGRNEYYVNSLPGKAWTTGNGVVLSGQRVQYGVHYGESERGAFCIGPVQWAGHWVFPYGWHCGYGQIVWEYGAINAAAGLDNPNSNTMTGFWQGAY